MNGAGAGSGSWTDVSAIAIRGVGEQRLEILRRHDADTDLMFVLYDGDKVIGRRAVQYEHLTRLIFTRL